MGSDGSQRARTRIRVQAPAGTDRLLLAQAIVGPRVLLKAQQNKSWQQDPFDRWKALNELYKRAVKLYQKQAEKLVAYIKRYVEDEIVGEKLSKAAGQPLVTPAQLQEIADIIRDYHTAIAVSVGSKDAVSEQEVQRLIDQGILPPETLDIIEDSYLYGQLVSTVKAMGDKQKLKKLSYDQFKKRIEKRPIPLTDQEKAAVDWAKHSAAVHIRGLGNQVADDFSTVAIESDAALRREMMGEVRDATEQNLKRRETWRRLASDLGHATEDWSRDFARIAATEKQRAMQEGYAQGLAKREGDPKETYVAKQPAPDACDDCVRLHLTSGKGSAPRIFTLDELAENGTNVGRKRRQWKAVVGTVHPWCQCELVHVPRGWQFESKPEGDEWKKVPGRAAWRKKDGDDWEYWRPSLVPEALERAARLDGDLRKAIMAYTDVPQKGVSIRVGDPERLAIVEKVVSETPEQVFDKDVGVTLITTDIPREGNALDDHDLAYWTGNEIRISQTLPTERWEKVLRHELGHSLNVHLAKKFGSSEAVRKWHKRLYNIAKEEGFVSAYARKEPIECAAECTRLYLYKRRHLMLKFPRQFGMLHDAYSDVFRPHVNGTKVR